jgi:hypothetical protein
MKDNKKITIYNFLKKNDRSTIGFADKELLEQMYYETGGKSKIKYLAIKNMLDYLGSHPDYFEQQIVKFGNASGRNFELKKEAFRKFGIN